MLSMWLTYSQSYSPIIISNRVCFTPEEASRLYNTVVDYKLVVEAYTLQIQLVETQSNIITNYQMLYKDATNALVKNMKLSKAENLNNSIKMGLIGGAAGIALTVIGTILLKAYLK